MVAKFSSISTRKLSKALTLLTTCDKKMVATSDYDEFHKLAKRCIMTSLLGASAQVHHFPQFHGHLHACKKFGTGFFLLWLVSHYYYVPVIEVSVCI